MIRANKKFIKEDDDVFVAFQDVKRPSRRQFTTSDKIAIDFIKNNGNKWVSRRHLIDFANLGERRSRTICERLRSEGVFELTVKQINNKLGIKVDTYLYRLSPKFLNGNI